LQQPMVVARVGGVSRIDPWVRGAAAAAARGDFAH